MTIQQVAMTVSGGDAETFGLIRDGGLEPSAELVRPAAGQPTADEQLAKVQQVIAHVRSVVASRATSRGTSGVAYTQTLRAAQQKQQNIVKNTS